jgi:steroid 5-alpha reductase family enzyme
MVSSQEARSRNLRNAALAAIVPLPAILFYLSFLHLCPNGSNEEENQVLDQWGLRVCKLGENHPIAFLNIIVFFCFSVLFWIISLFQQSTWLVDPYWTIVPVMIGYYYSTHPHAKSDPWRSTTVMILLWVWNIRLEHSYFRREKWQWGATEDWRFADMRKQYQGHWWWASFFLCYISQQILLVGICLPLYAVFSSNSPWNMWDTLATLLCGTGIVISYFADSQLHRFVSKNENLKDLGVPTEPLLETGLWRYSRHPNYFGEQLWWWALALYAWNLGQGWLVVGTIVNSACMAKVTVMVEQRMMQKPSRAAIFHNYQQSTSVWIPWFKLQPQKKAKKIM